MAFKGRDIILKVDISGTLTPVAVMQAKKIAIINESVDITTDADNGWQALFSDTGSRHMAVEGSAIFDNSASLEIFQNNSFSDTPVTIEIELPDGTLYNGSFKITNFDDNAEHLNVLMSSFALIGSGPVTRGSASTTFTFTVTDSDDDAEEYETALTITDSSDLELGNDPALDYYNQFVGVRMNLDVINGLTIDSSILRFRVDEVSIEPNCVINISAELSLNAAPIADNVAGSLSGRPLTANSVQWTVPPWPTVGDSGAAQETPDLSTITQEIIDQPGWVSSSFILFILTPDVTSTGTRIADSRDSTSTGPPRLLTVHSSGTVNVNTPVPTGADDAEEAMAGTVFRPSNDLEFGFIDNTVRHIGVRLSSVVIPQGATINSASLQFKADRTDADPLTTSVYMEDIDSSPPIDPSDAFNISTRTATSSTPWVMPAWTLGDQGSDQLTPDLTAQVQAVVNRPGWVSGNAMMIIINGAGATATRIAVSSDGASPSSEGPTFTVNYS